MYDYIAANNIAKQKHQEMIAEAKHMAQVRQQRKLNQSATQNTNHLLFTLTHLFTR